MKKIAFLLSLVILVFACNKSSNDDPEPIPVENYKITYSFKSFGLENLEYIKYINADGNEIKLTDKTEFELSFERPSNNIHALLEIKGELKPHGGMGPYLYWADFKMTVTDKDDKIISIKESSSELPGNFYFQGEYKNIEI